MFESLKSGMRQSGMPPPSTPSSSVSSSSPSPPTQPLLLQASLTLLALLLSSSTAPAARLREEGGGRGEGLALVPPSKQQGRFRGHTALMLLILKLMIEEPAILQVRG